MFVLVCSLNLFAQELPNSQLNKVILTVEAFLNNEITPYNEYTIISVEEWYYDYEKGYTSVKKNYNIQSYPYEEIINLNEITENIINIIDLFNNQRKH
jgi:hypothetical protein